MHAIEPKPRSLADDHGRDEREDLERQIRQLEERLAFYEGFDALIQDNVTHARELFRQAAQEREAAAATAEHARRHADHREAALYAELDAVAAELTSLAKTVDRLAQRIASALGEPRNGRRLALVAQSDQTVAVVIHGVQSARTALSLQRFVETLPHVSDVAAREFVGGVLRLDVRARERLQAEQFGAWEDAPGMHLLTERPDVVEFALGEPNAPDRILP